jgi:hypothetical protein
MIDGKKDATWTSTSHASPSIEYPNNRCWHPSCCDEGRLCSLLYHLDQIHQL